MIRGVFFKTRPCSDPLYQILKCIDIEKYCWHNIDSQNEVWGRPQGTIFFEKDYYTGQDFLQQIQSNHFIVFLKLQAYFNDSSFFDIQSYEQFQKSDCQLLLLVYDCESVAVYAKDQMIAGTIYENALKNNYMEIEYITETNDARTKMNVM